MSNISIHSNENNNLIRPDVFDFEVVERKFRGHPDSLADMVAQRFSQLYIQHAWQTFPELSNKWFPNFSADKITLSGASTEPSKDSYTVLKPINALLIGKITQSIGSKSLDVELIFSKAIEDIFGKALGHTDAHTHVVRELYSVSLAGTDHDPSFYNPKSSRDLIRVTSQETFANDTVYVVAYAPLSLTEKLSIKLDNITDSTEFKNLYPEIGSDIKTMIRRRGTSYDITICLPVFPEKISSISLYQDVINGASSYLKKCATCFLAENTEGADKPFVQIYANTKDTPDKKYFAVWGTSLSKGDIGAVGRGNRPQGFISGMRPSTNEAVSGKNPNHFAGIIYQLISEEISNSIYTKLKIRNAVYITANNGDLLDKPHSIDVVTENITLSEEKYITEIIGSTLNSVDAIKQQYINGDVYKKFMNPTIQ